MKLCPPEVEKIRQDMVALVATRLAAGENPSYSRSEMDGFWDVAVKPDGALILGGYAEDFLAGKVQTYRDLPLCELAMLLDPPSNHR
jgi:hypothetical protein